MNALDCWLFYLDHLGETPIRRWSGHPDDEPPMEPIFFNRLLDLFPHLASPEDWARMRLHHYVGRRNDRYFQDPERDPDSHPEDLLVREGG